MSGTPTFCVLLACRYLFVDSILAAVQASPASKVATLSQESLALLLSVRTELDAAQRQAPAAHEVGPQLPTFVFCLERAMLSLYTGQELLYHLRDPFEAMGIAQVCHCHDLDLLLSAVAMIQGCPQSAWLPHNICLCVSCCLSMRDDKRCFAGHAAGVSKPRRDCEGRS